VSRTTEKNAVTQIKKDGNTQQNPDDACRCQETPDRLKRTRPEKEKNEPDHDDFCVLIVLIFDFLAE
jgi:hypothetical protein